MAFMASPWVAAAFAGVQLLQGMRAASDAEKVADANHAIELQNAEYLRESQRQEQEELRYRQRKHLATQRANAGKSGVALTGSPIAVLGEIEYRQLLDYHNFVKTNDVEYWRARNQANMNLYTGYQKASQIRTDAVSSAGTTLLSAKWGSSTGKSAANASSYTSPQVYSQRGTQTGLPLRIG